MHDSLRRSAGRLLLIVVLLSPTVAHGGESDEFVSAFRGVIHDLLADFRAGDADARKKASAQLLDRGSFALPYVLVAAEATPDEGYRARLLALAGRIRAELPERPLADLFRGARNLPGFAEYPPWDLVASNLAKNRWRIAAEHLALYARPPGIEAALVHVAGERWGAALECLIAFARAHPDRIEEALEVARWSPICDRPAHADRMAVLENLAIREQEAAPAERASLLAFHRANLLRNVRLKELAKVVETWPGEEGGLRARHELIEDSRNSMLERFREQVALCDEHPGRPATRLGLQNAIFQATSVNLSRKDFNSVARLREVAALFARLSSDEFTGGEGCFEATQKTAGFFISSRVTADEAKVLLKAYRVFLAHHFLVDELVSPAVGLGWYVKNRFPKLHGVLGVPKESIGQVLLEELDAIERKAPEKAPVRCFRAILLAEQGKTDEAVAILKDLREKLPDRFYGRKALAVQAALLYSQGKLDEAAELYALYTERHPASVYAWVAALRAGHARARQGAWDEAVTAWERARERFPAHPLVSVLVPIALARTFEERGNLTEALTQYRAALDAWPAGCKDHLGTPLQGIRRPKNTGLDPDAGIGRDGLLHRIRELSRTDVEPSALALYLSANRLWARGDSDGAVAKWRQCVDDHPDSPLADEVRGILGKVLIGIALTAESRQEADGHLALAAAEGDRFTKFAVELCRSIADLALEGGREIARERLGRAFATWERETVLREPSTPLSKDLAAIRRQVFRPRDERFFHRAWKPDSWPGYKVVSPETEVVFPDGTKKTVTLYHSYPEVEGVVQFTADERGMIQTILDGFGGDKRTRPGWIMAIPQPKGMAKTIREFMNDFIKLVPGHWGGWHIRTYPTLNSVVFRDAGRTGATAKYRVKYRGGDAAMVKSDGQWRIKETQFTWME